MSRHSERTRLRIARLIASIASLLYFALQTPAQVSTQTWVWVDDDLPVNAIAFGGEDGWNWTTNPAPFSATRAHQSAALAGLHQHFFTSATETLPVATGDRLFAYVYLDPANPPSEVMLQFNDGSWEHRAYWGANLIGYGTDGTNGRRFMGPLPAAGGWVRLEVPASLLGLENGVLNGMAFTLYNGRATWDSAGKVPASETVWVDDALPAGANPAGDDGWNWVASNPFPASGGQAHQSLISSGVHQHFFFGATQTLSVGPNDSLFAYVYLDPANMPREVMLQFNDGSWEHRAYWGENLLGWGTDNTNGRRRAGPLPRGGGWVRLEVPAALVGLEGATLNGMAFSLYNGRATWDRAGKTPGGNETIWVEDSAPAGANLAVDGDVWNWTGANPPPFAGTVAHQSNAAAGQHQHFFFGAAETLSVAPGDSLFAYVYLDPANPPSEVMLQWNDGSSWEHRAYWGANLLGWGVDGTNSRRNVGPLPAAGVWTRLEVPASLVGLEGATVSGMAFSLYNGRATWDSAGKASSAGGWSPPNQFPVVAIHSHVLPNGRILFWSRDVDAAGNEVSNGTQAWTWNPADNLFTPAANGVSNIFCAGHAFLPDGRLMVTGGHDAHDNYGLPHANIYNYADNTWTRTQDMNKGRWYPTSTALANGESLVVSGDYFDPLAPPPGIRRNNIPQIWNPTSGTWRELSNATKEQPLYPWLFQAPNGKVFNAGPAGITDYLDVTGSGSWADVDGTNWPFSRGEGSAAMFDAGKILIVGGHIPIDDPNNSATNTAEVIDLNQPSPVWYEVAPMNYARQHHNATLLPDGRVLVTGGEHLGVPVKVAEVWDPQAGDPIPGTSLRRGTWTVLASGRQTRVYHSTALLMPDGRVMSAGGGLPGTIYKYAEFFSPPYLFKGRRPQISSAPQSVLYNQTFFVGTPDTNITRATLIRLPSVTHSFDQNQRLNDLSATLTPAAGGYNLTAPANGNLCPPGHYMLFLLNSQGVPSVASIIQISGGTPVSGGLRADYFNTIDLTGGALTRTDATVDFNWGLGSPDPSISVDNFSARWTGQVQPLFSQTYTFYTVSDDGVRLWVNNQLVIDKWIDQAPTEWSGQITLQAGQLYDIRMEFYERGGGATARLLWSSPSQPKEVIPSSRLYRIP